MSTVPTDSVLYRHYEQMQQAARLTPTDSVLRRHHEQMQRAARSIVAPAPASRPAEPAAPRREPQAASRPVAPVATSEPAADPPGGGFFGWLKRLFGG